MIDEGKRIHLQRGRQLVMADSIANMPGFSPGARMYVGVGTFSSTTRFTARMFGDA